VVVPLLPPRRNMIFAFEAVDIVEYTMNHCRERLTVTEVLSESIKCPVCDRYRCCQTWISMHEMGVIMPYVYQSHNLIPTYVNCMYCVYYANYRPYVELFLGAAALLFNVVKQSPDKGV
jgi:hypothetical protein